MSASGAVNWTLTTKHDPDLAKAKKRLDSQHSETRKMIRVLTAEQALLAQRVVREAGR